MSTNNESDTETNHPMRNLSKSKIIAFRQCPKRLWLEIHKPELRDDSASEAVFAIGNQVGEIARGIYDPDQTGVTIDIGELGHAEALARSASLLAEGKGPVFEAGLTAAGALAYADVMMPDRSDGTLRWRMIEVKSSGSVKPYQRDDLAVQSYLAARADVTLSSASIAHIDNQFIYQGDGDYRGLLHEENLTAEASSRHDEVALWIAGAQDIAAQTGEPDIATGPHCAAPYACGFSAYCNKDKVWPEYPISSFPNLSGWRRDAVEAEETDDIRQIPDHLLTLKQLRIKQVCVNGEAYFDAEGAAADLASHGFPAYFLDFETVMFTVPIWKGTRPFRQIPFQFSLHILEESGAIQHHGFLDLSGNDPSMACAKALVDLCGEHGPVFAYNAGFEKMIIRQLAGRFPEYATALQAIIERIVDLRPIATSRYYHPSQHGSWSLKSVLPALCPDLSYDSLDGVQNGGMAQQAYQESIASETTGERKTQLKNQLHEYCKLDTLAMVRMWEVFRGGPNP
jgi:hypothetical protein